MQLCVARSTNKTMVGRFCGTARVKHLEETFEGKISLKEVASV